MIYLIYSLRCVTGPHTFLRLRDSHRCLLNTVANEHYTHALRTFPLHIAPTVPILPAVVDLPPVDTLFTRVCYVTFVAISHTLIYSRYGSLFVIVDLIPFTIICYSVDLLLLRSTFHICW